MHPKAVLSVVPPVLKPCGVVVTVWSSFPIQKGQPLYWPVILREARRSKVTNLQSHQNVSKWVTELRPARLESSSCIMLSHA